MQRGLALSSRLAAWQAVGSSLFSGLWGAEAGLVRQGAPVLSRLTSLIPSLNDMAWLAAPKRKVRCRRTESRSAAELLGALVVHCTSLVLSARSCEGR